MNCIKQLHEMFQGAAVLINIEFPTPTTACVIISPKLTKGKESITVRPILIQGTIEEIEAMDWSKYTPAIEEIKTLIVDMIATKEDLVAEIKEETEKKETKAKKAAEKTATKVPVKEVKKVEHDFSKCEAHIKTNPNMAVYLVKQMIEKHPADEVLKAKLAEYEAIRDKTQAPLFAEVEQEPVVTPEVVPLPEGLGDDDDFSITA